MLSLKWVGISCTITSKKHYCYIHFMMLTISLMLAQDILPRIHALMPIRDAAQAACVSRAFLRSWRYYPRLMLSVDSLGVNEYGSKYDELTRDFISRVDHIMQNHSGMGVKEFRLQNYPCSTIDPSTADRSSCHYTRD